MKQPATYFLYMVANFLLILVTLSCDHADTEAASYGFIGGEIINPKNNTVIIYNTKSKVADTLTLDGENRFLHKITDLQAGLYSILHGGEYQTVILEPRDSIMFRVNTYDFDESLVFTGAGSKKNNYLINLYLTNEREERKLMSYSQMQPQSFHNFVEERRKKQRTDFDVFTKTNNVSPYFKSVIEAYIDYTNYADKEIYPFAYFGNNKLVHIKDLPDYFYDYRKNIDYNANYLGSFYFYNRFLFSHFDNLALKAFYEKNDFHSTFNRHSLAYNKAKLELIDSLIMDEDIKNSLLKYKTREFISQIQNETEAHDMLAFYLSKSTNDTDKTNMQDLVNSLSGMQKGRVLPNLTIIDLNNVEHNILNVIKRPTIIYFWTSNLKSQYRNSHYKVNELKAKFPNLDFISININDTEDRFWKQIISQYDFPKSCEYKFKNNKASLKLLAINYVNKSIIVDKNASILHPNTNIFDSKFEDTLTQLIQNKSDLK